MPFNNYHSLTGTSSSIFNEIVKNKFGFIHFVINHDNGGQYFTTNSIYNGQFTFSHLPS